MPQVDKLVNSYVSEQEAQEYFETRLYADAWENAEIEQKQKALIMATNLLDLNFTWAGEKENKEQSLEFPRNDIRYSEGLPKAIITAQMELALILLQSNVTALPETAGIKSVQVDTIKLELDASDRTKLIPDPIQALIKPYLAQKDTYKPVFNMTR